MTITFAFILGTFFGLIIYRFKLGTYRKIGDEIIKKAEDTAESTRKNGEFELKQKELELQKKINLEIQREKQKIQREEDRLKGREDKLEKRLHQVEKNLSDLKTREARLIQNQEDLNKDKEQLKQSQQILSQKLEKISGLTSKEAKELLLNELTSEVKSEAANFIRRTIKEAEEDAERKASRILATAINRLAVPCVSECTVNTVALPNDELKGRIVGREGRNIRTLEQATGVNFVIDDTPGAVVISGFDPIRLHVAKLALTELVTDGRIHPTRIEEAVEKAKNAVQKKIKQYGEDAALRAGQINLHPELITLLGKLKFRYSYGQNVLDHSLEVSHLMGMITSELGLDGRLAKRIGLLHDIGKAVTHEIDGTHAVIGHDLALKYGESDEVANGIGCHHKEMDPITVEASLCGSVDAISASRTGARIEAVEEYIKRLKRLEDIAYDFPAVEKAYAMQAGREVRIVVLPDMIDDDGIINLARDLTKRIEKDLHYHGKIKVTVIREKRAVEYAI